MKTSSKIYTALIMLFLFAPIAILLVFSFNESKSLSVFSGFSLYWYKELLRDSETLNAVKNTLLLACCASAISTVMGTAAAVGMNKLRNRYVRAVMDTATNIPMINPEIITGISLMLMFVFVGRLFGAATSLSFWTMLIAHVTFCLPYVILQVLPKLQQMDKSLPEAAMDLGCTPVRACPPGKPCALSCCPRPSRTFCRPSPTNLSPSSRNPPSAIPSACRISCRR